MTKLHLKSKKRLIPVTIIGLIFFWAALTQPPHEGIASEMTGPDTINVEAKIEERLQDKEQIVQDLREIKPKTKVVTKREVKVKTKVVMEYKERDVYIKYGDRYFQTKPSIDEAGSYIIDLDVVNKQKKEHQKKLKKPNFFQRIFQ